MLQLPIEHLNWTAGLPRTTVDDMSGLFFLMFVAVVSIPVLVAGWGASWLFFNGGSRPSGRLISR